MYPNRFHRFALIQVGLNGKRRSFLVLNCNSLASLLARSYPRHFTFYFRVSRTLNSSFFTFAFVAQDGIGERFMCHAPIFGLTCDHLIQIKMVAGTGGCSIQRRNPFCSEFARSILGMRPRTRLLFEAIGRSQSYCASRVTSHYAKYSILLPKTGRTAYYGRKIRAPSATKPTG